jgi:hypothetical protein
MLVTRAFIPTGISNAVEYDNEAWVEARDRLGGRM